MAKITTTTKRTKREIEVEEEDEDELEDDDDTVDELDDEDDEDEDEDDEDEDDEDFDDIELDLDLDQEVGEPRDFDDSPLPQGLYAAEVVGEMKDKQYPSISKVQFGPYKGQPRIGFPFRIVGGKRAGRIVWKNVDFGATDNSGRSILAMTLAGILGGQTRKVTTVEELREVLEETQDVPVYVRVNRYKAKQGARKGETLNGVSLVFPADDKHPSNDVSDEDDD